MSTDKNMMKIGRKRRAAGWTLLALGVLVVGVWVASGFGSVSRYPAGGGFWIGSGTIGIETFPPQSGRPGWMWRGRDLAAVRWRFTADPLDDVLWGTTWNYRLIARQDTKALPGRPNFGGVLWTVAFWPIPLLLLPSAALFLRSGILARRRASTGVCVKCGYSLAGLAGGFACPECGNGTGTT